MAEQEERRREWLTYYAKEGKYDKALEMAVTPAEVEAINELKEKEIEEEDLGLMGCLPGGGKMAGNDYHTTGNGGGGAAAEYGEGGGGGGGGEVEVERPFVTAIKEYNWAAAEALAETAEDTQDLIDSKARVEIMFRDVTEGKFDHALELAITEQEVEEIQAKRAETRG